MSDTANRVVSVLLARSMQVGGVFRHPGECVSMTYPEARACEAAQKGVIVALPAAEPEADKPKVKIKESIK